MIDNFYAIDYQTHSYRSHDGRASILEHCKQAVEIGLDELGLSEHKDFDPDDPMSDYFDYDSYMTEIEIARRQFSGRLKILAGVEIDYQVWFEDKIANYLDLHKFDFVIGSVHYVDKLMLMTPEYNLNRTKKTAYSDYFQAVGNSVQSGKFDIVGHLEYANRRGVSSWGEYSTGDYEDSSTALFKLMIEKSIPLEINTAGLHQNLGITYPCSETVALYGRLGGRLLSIASDAHHPDQLAHAYSTAANLAIQNGLTHLCTWKNREMTLIPLQS